MKKLYIFILLYCSIILNIYAQENKLEDYGITMLPVPNTNILMSQTEITNHSYYAITGHGKDDFFPKNYISWADAVDFCNKLSIKMGLKPVYSYKGSTDLYLVLPGDMTYLEQDLTANGFRLPLEKEWKTACASGASYFYLSESEAEELSWNNENSQGKIHSVAEKMANQAGFYDMTGNVSEWVWDYRTEGSLKKRKFCGGNYENRSDYQNSYNMYKGAGITESTIGFRIVKNQ